jgi:hypothetical protein
VLPLNDRVIRDSAVQLGLTHQRGASGVESSPCSYQVLAGVATDEATNGNLASNVITFTFDTTAPTLIISSAETTVYTNVNPLPFTFTWNEPVYGFVTAGVTATGGAKSNFAGVDGELPAHRVSVSLTDSEGSLCSHTHRLLSASLAEYHPLSPPAVAYPPLLSLSLSLSHTRTHAHTASQSFPEFTFFPWTKT